MTTRKKKAPAGSRKNRKRKSRKLANIQLTQRTRILLASAFLLAFVGLCLLALVGLRSKFVPFSEKVSFVYEEPVDAVHQQKTYTYEDIQRLLVEQLLNGPQAQGWRKLEDRNQVEVRKIFGAFPSDLFLSELSVHIAETGSPAQLRVDRDQGLIGLLWQDELRFELRYQRPAPTPARRGKVAIVMDDMGNSLATFRRLLELDLMITPAILPGTLQALPATELLQAARREYMLHIPMQPRSYPQINPGENALLLGQSADEIRRRMQFFREAIPGAVGGNNHMGSRYTEEIGPMRVVLEELKKNSQFFIDSRTIGSSVAFSEARKMGLRTATRNIFLDNRDDVDYIRSQIRKMVKLAANNREVIAICHPYRETLEAFELELEWLKRQPVDYVAASEVVHFY
jgi:polysaccharide deacetylase 2 family uncharacterized protein YibQ